MSVKRIVANIATDSPGDAEAFYGDLLGLVKAIDQGWISTFATAPGSPQQVSFASDGGSGTPVPDLSIEVDDLEGLHQRMVEAGVKIEYGPVTEPWGVRRFHVRDPFGRLLNILSHAD